MCVELLKISQLRLAEICMLKAALVESKSYAAALQALQGVLNDHGILIHCRGQIKKFPEVFIQYPELIRVEWRGVRSSSVIAERYQLLSHPFLGSGAGGEVHNDEIWIGPQGLVHLHGYHEIAGRHLGKVAYLVCSCQHVCPHGAVIRIGGAEAVAAYVNHHQIITPYCWLSNRLGRRWHADIPQ